MSARERDGMGDTHEGESVCESVDRCFSVLGRTSANPLNGEMTSTSVLDRCLPIRNKEAGGLVSSSPPSSHGALPFLDILGPMTDNRISGSEGAR